MDEEVGTSKKRVIKFRNYQPYDTSLLKLAEETPVPTSTSAASVDTAASTTAKSVLAPQAQVQSRKKAGGSKDEEDIIKVELDALKSDELHIVPKKQNQDLKNMVASRLEKLKRRTQRAIVDILREKMTSEEDSSDDD